MIRILLIIFVAHVAISGGAAIPRPPNVVFIMADDLGYRELGCFGQEKIRTPNIDKLAGGGMKLTRHYAGNAVCAPSRCVLMTGKHPGHAFVRNNRAMRPEGQLPIPDSEITLAELFKKNGYVTGAFGKWGLGPVGSSGDPNARGFDQFYGYNCQAKAHTYYPESLWSNNQVVKLNNSPPVPGHAGLPAGADPKDPASYDIFKGEDYAPDRINREALRFIARNREKPFFLYYPSIIPHVALHVPDEELRPYLDLGWDDPPFTREGGGYTPHFTPRAAYAAMITLLDKYVGRILLLLDLYGLEENTIVVFTSDNGTTHLLQEVDYHFFKSVGELRGLKGQLYEGGIRVPGIVKWPGKIAAGSQSNAQTGFEDWIPTLLDLTGHGDGIPQGLDGISFAKVLTGNGDSFSRPFLYREFTGYRGQQALWMGNWKAVRTNMLQRKNPDPLKISLYNLESDIREQNDLSGGYPEIVSTMSRIMSEQHIPSAEFPFAPID